MAGAERWLWRGARAVRGLCRYLWERASGWTSTGLVSPRWLGDASGCPVLLFWSVIVHLPCSFTRRPQPRSRNLC